MLKSAKHSSDHKLLKSFSEFTAWLWGQQFASGCFYDTVCLKSYPDRWDQSRGWRWQKCFEMAFLQRAPTTQAPLRSPALFLRTLLQQCDDVFGLGQSGKLALNNAALQAARGASHPNGTTNVFFTNFSDDPWQYAGVKPLEKKHHTAGMHRCYVECDDCGHCMDLHQPSSSDPKPLKKCRKAAVKEMEKWLRESGRVEAASFFSLDPLALDVPIKAAE